MVENGVRLKYLIDDDSFIITNVLTGKVLAYSNGSYQIANLDIKVVLQEISTLVESFTGANDKFLLFAKRGVEKDNNLRIEHVKHFEWTMSLHGYKCKLTSELAERSRKFEDTLAMTRLQFVYSVLLQSQGAIRKPKVEVVRRISDAKLLLWVNNGHTVVHSEAAAQGMMMVNCLVDGIAYDYLQVSPSKTTQTCGLFTLDGQLVCEFPLDDSILAYYKPAEEMFEEE